MFHQDTSDLLFLNTQICRVIASQNRVFPKKRYLGTNIESNPPADSVPPNDVIIASTIEPLLSANPEDLRGETKDEAGGEENKKKSKKAKGEENEEDADRPDGPSI